ncbi:MAG: hypothetical protein B6D39_12460 [Anaerolineae bacterium UTCFX2]|nr:MAG: hypothetical protein B6D39_12460 [Anaerolineae bacterium UTCFX2]
MERSSTADQEIGPKTAVPPRTLRLFIAVCLLVLAAQAVSPPRRGFTQGAALADFQVFLPFVSKNYQPLLGSLADGWYLMVDDAHIQARGVERLYHPFRKFAGNPVIRPDKSWEGHIIQLFGTVLPGFRMWYSSLNPEQSRAQVLYAESVDGVHWNKPAISYGANALFNGQNANLPSVLHTPHDLAAPFKLMVYQNGDFYGYASPDGLATTAYSQNPLYTAGSDVAHFYWDETTGRYRGSSKTIIEIFGVARRAIRLVNSDDFIHWQEQPDLFVPDIIDELVYPGFSVNFYGMPIFPVGEQYLGMLWVMKATDLTRQYGQVVVQLASSHDGKSWQREEGNRPPILDVGPPGAWDGGQVYTSAKPLRLGDELWLYYSGCNREHGANLRTTNCAIGLAKAGYHRLASLSGSGQILTQPLMSAGETLHLNYDGSKGALRVEVQQDGQPVPGYEAVNCLPLTSDRFDQLVAWNAHTALPEGNIQLLFLLQDSALYAFKLGD